MLNDWGFGTINRDWLLAQEQPFFLYSHAQILSNIQSCRKVLTQVGQWSECKVRYSSKANPNAHILKLISDHVDGFDASSLLELQMLKSLGIAPDRVTLSGPGKTDEALRFACEWGIFAIHVESQAELSVLRNFRGHHPRPEICLRIEASNFATQGEGKLAWREEDLRQLLAKESGHTFAGIHCYMGRESFSAERLDEDLKKASHWMTEFPRAFAPAPRFHLGPGIPAIQDWANFEASMKSLPLSGKIDFELGRALVATAGIYAASVLSVKRSTQGRKVIILDGGIQHLGSPLISMHQPHSEARRSLTVRDGHVLKDVPLTQAALFGSLCLWHDCLHPSLDVPADLGRGDWLFFSGCGAYGLTAAVPHFIGEDLPKEYLLEPGNAVPRDITPENYRSYHQSFEEILHV